MKTTVERRAVHIAAVIMQADGLCRHGKPEKCGKVFPTEDAECVKCIESWLLSRARKELRKEGKVC